MRGMLHLCVQPCSARSAPGARRAQGVSFGVFGLGNKQYEHFCAVGKRMYRALASLGATALVPKGEGNDDDDIEADFELWRTELYQALDKATVLAKSQARAEGARPPARVRDAARCRARTLPVQALLGAAARPPRWCTGGQLRACAGVLPRGKEPARALRAGRFGELCEVWADGLVTAASPLAV